MARAAPGQGFPAARTNRAALTGPAAGQRASGQEGMAAFGSGSVLSVPAHPSPTGTVPSAGRLEARSARPGIGKQKEHGAERCNRGMTPWRMVGTPRGTDYQRKSIVTRLLHDLLHRRNPLFWLRFGPVQVIGRTDRPAQKPPTDSAEEAKKHFVEALTINQERCRLLVAYTRPL